MSPHDDFEIELRRVLFAEAERIDLPATVWPRLEAQLARAQTQFEHGSGLDDIARAGNIRELILAVLTDREMDHFTLVQMLDAATRKTGAQSQQVQHLAVLHQLEREGLLSARWQPTSRGVRRMYRAARRGHRVHLWLRGARRLARLVAWARPSSARRAPLAEEMRD